MSWWVKKNGHVEGPYLECDVRKRIDLNLIGSLDRVSQDKQNWHYLKDSELWRREPSVRKSDCSAGSCSSTVVSPGKMSRGEHSQTYPRERYDDGSDMPIPERLRLSEAEGTSAYRQGAGKTVIIASCCACAVVVMAMLGLCLFTLSSRFGNISESKETTEGNADKSGSRDVVPAMTTGFKVVRDAVALIECKEGSSGTGFLLEMDGKTYLVSNEHVVRSGSRIEARLIDGTLLNLGEFSVAADKRDLARFEVMDCDKMPLKLRTSMPNIGEQVTVYGNSLGGGVATESKGFIQGVGPTKLETNAEIVNGNSGSPLLDTSNTVVGVAAMMELTDTGKENWGNTNTRYDGKVRRYAVRLNDVRWKIVERGRYEEQVRAFGEFRTFWTYFVPFLIFDSLNIDKEKLVYNDLCARDFKMSETGFNEVMKDVAKAYERRGKAFIRWDDRRSVGRKELVRRLNLEVDSKQMTEEAAKNALREYDKKTLQAYDKMKEAFQLMITVRKEALSHAQSFLRGRTWDAPQMQSGYGDEGGGVDAYSKIITRGIDLMNQRMKDLNKDIKELEKGDDDDEDD